MRDDGGFTTVHVKSSLEHGSAYAPEPHFDCLPHGVNTAQVAAPLAPQLTIYCIRTPASASGVFARYHMGLAPVRPKRLSQTSEKDNTDNRGRAERGWQRHCKIEIQC